MTDLEELMLDYIGEDLKDAAKRARAKIDAQAKRIEELEAILQRAVNEAPYCSCLDDYKKRGRIDPTCVRCNHFAPWIDDAKKALEDNR